MNFNSLTYCIPNNPPGDGVVPALLSDAYIAGEIDILTQAYNE